MLKIFRYTILFFSIAMFFIGMLFLNYNILLLAICSILIHNLWYSCEKFSERIIFFAFNSTFFTFLVARLVVKPLTGYYDKYNNNMYGLDFNNSHIMLQIFIILFISLLFLFLGYCGIKNNDFLINNKSKVFNRIRIADISFVSKILFYITYIFNFLVLLDKARFTSKEGYTELYASYSSSFPFWVDKLAEMCPTALFVYLGTLPSKRNSLIPLMLYLLSGGMSLVVGQRNNFVLNILIVLIYFCLRNITDKNEKWFGKKEIIMCISAFPLLIILLNAVSYFRMDGTVMQSSFLDGISEFFYAQGVSVNLIGYAQTLALPESKSYAFGRIIDFINNNIITQTLFDVPKYSSQSVESALYGNSFADSVAYILSPSRFINGWGYGSSYIAELYKDFGYYGIVIGNFIVGIILALMTRLFRKGVLGIWMCLSMTRLILYAPRDTFTSFIVSTFSLINFLTLFVIFLGAIILSGKKGKTSIA
ncbi:MULTISPECIES: O-antigen polysaccharide polymerase Wzy family protein [unclassified Bacillus (in: firmicutes)]|uniref:O-antigen polysaccharide polymerase Wzy family protein n=1 Tax=unclassified Bacillus (in: firmicutes) TaxID=185979 RepID=UPI001BE8CE69|nr:MULTISPECIES: O-antigen polysaccharide polymerase Wzy family protein [unclassified Bacillus (in: firmicutes)]MBT2616775.1 O-antigen polysaccharide polymerase Wzy family protein [Bacillus sp. ISL-78]MBT2631493.1 O-antigen polysaccharide polymerase Wzy family protein [Bacillus sp. ISL-101]